MGIRNCLRNVLVWILCIVIVAQPVFGAVSNFKDVSESDWFYEGVYSLSERGLISASDDNTFRPYDTMSVAEFITLMVRSQGAEIIEIDGEWYEKYIRAGVKSKLLPEGLFGDQDYNRPIKRGEAARLFLRLMHRQGEINPVNYSQQFVSHIKDIDSIDDSYKNAVLICYAKGIMDRYADGSFCVERTLSRAEISLMFYRVLDESVRVLPKLDNQEVATKEPIVETVLKSSPEELVEDKVVYPEVISNTKLTILHDEVDAWLWNDIDSEYLENNKLTRSQLRKERDLLKGELHRLENLRLEVNGYVYYPALLTLKMTSVERALKAREGRLKGIDTYPTKFDTIVASYVTEYEFDWNEDNFLEERIILSDKDLYDTLKEFPYDFCKGVNVLVVPSPSRAAGSIGYNPIYITAGTKMAGEVFYHEMGHLWAWNYLYNGAKVDYSKYLTIRGQDVNREDKNYYNSTSENFAEDFRVSLRVRTGPFMSNMTTFGLASEEIQKNLKEYILEEMKRQSNLNTSYEETYFYDEK